MTSAAHELGNTPSSVLTIPLVPGSTSVAAMLPNIRPYMRPTRGNTRMKDRALPMSFPFAVLPMVVLVTAVITVPTQNAERHVTEAKNIMRAVCRRLRPSGTSSAVNSPATAMAKKE